MTKHEQQTDMLEKMSNFFPEFLPGGQNNGEPTPKSGGGSVDEFKKQEKFN